MGKHFFCNCCRCNLFVGDDIEIFVNKQFYLMYMIWKKKRILQNVFFCATKGLPFGTNRAIWVMMVPFYTFSY